MSVFAYDSCKDGGDIPCIIFTPSISCTELNYAIFDTDNLEVQNDSLNLVSGSIYSLTFNLTTSSDYIIKLCDGSTMEVTLSGTEPTTEDNNMGLGLVITMLVFGILCMIWANFFGVEHIAMRMFLFLMSVLSIIGALYLSSVVIGVDTTIQPAIGTITQWITWFFYIILVYVIIEFVKAVFAYIANQKMKKYNYKRD